MLNFQKLDVYRCSIDFLALAVKLSTKIPRGYGTVSDQLRRAALSTPLNIAEGCGRPTDADAARHYGIARGSAMECAAIIDALHVLSTIDEDEYVRGNELLERLVAMLSRMSR